MSKHTIVFFEKKGDEFRKDIKSYLKDKGALTVIKLPKLPKGSKDPAKDDQLLHLKVAVEVDEGMYKVLVKDSGLYTRMQEQCKTPYARCCEAICSTYEVANAKFALFVPDGKDPKARDKVATAAYNEGMKHVQKLVDDMGKLAQKTWEDYRKTVNAYRDYQISIAVTLTIAGTGLVAGLALTLATPFTFGASTFFGILGMAKGTATLITEVGHAMEEPIDTIKKSEELLIKIFSKMDKDGTFGKAWKAKQYSAELVNAFSNIALSVEPLPSLSKLKERIARADAKVQGVMVKWHKLTTKITTCSESMERYEKETKPQLAKMVATNDWSHGVDPVGLELFYADTYKTLIEKTDRYLTKLDSINRELDGYTDPKDKKYHPGLRQRLAALHVVFDTMLQKTEARNLEKFSVAMGVLAFVGNLAVAGASLGSFNAQSGGDIANLILTVLTSDLGAIGTEKASVLGALALDDFQKGM